MGVASPRSSSLDTPRPLPHQPTGQLGYSETPRAPCRELLALSEDALTSTGAWDWVRSPGDRAEPSQPDHASHRDPRVAERARREAQVSTDARRRPGWCCCFSCRW